MRTNPDNSTTARDDTSAPLWVRQIATVFGAGYSPVAPGTAGALCAMPAAILLCYGSFSLRLIVAVVVTLIGTVAADRYARATGQKDPSAVVVDEFAGILVTFIAVPITFWTAILGFVFFRLFDIWKPPPINWLDQNVKGGLGIMVDDLVAGAFALLLLRGLIWLC